MIYRNEPNRLAKGVHTGGRAGGAARKKVTIQTYGLDKYGRSLADVVLPDGTNVNRSLVKKMLVLVVSAICAGEYGAGTVREGRTRD